MFSYFICTGYMGQAAYLWIGESEFEAIRNAQKALFSISELEEKYNLIISAYADLEKEIHSTNIEYVLQGNALFDQNHFSARERLNLKIMSLLTSIRLFQDRAPSWLSAISDESKEAFCVKRSEIFDQNIDYQFIEKFRNYAQHYQTPIDDIRYKGEWINDRETLRYTVRLQSLKEKLSRAKKIFSASFLDKIDDDIDLLKLIRSYISHLSVLIKFSRTELNEHYMNSTQIFQSYINEYKAGFGNPIGLKGCKYSSAEQINVEEINISERLLHYIETARSIRDVTHQLKRIEISI